MPSNMAAGRWYPTITALANGEMLVTAGQVNGCFQNETPERWQGSSWVSLGTGAQRTLPYYPWMFQAPNGKVFNAGPNREAKYLDVAAGTWEATTYTSSQWRTPGVGGNTAGSAVMYEPGKILILGGSDGGAPTNSTERIDLNAATPAWLPNAPMAYPRCHANATLLPDGTVLVTGGTSRNNSQESGGILPAEIWTPGQGTQPGSWRTVAAMVTPRLYHSTAVLLPDGRVLTAGGGQGGGFADHPTAQIYSPPYLFTGRTRPVISSAPTALAYGNQVQVQTPSTDVARATLVRLSSVTHSFNMNQRFNWLPVTSFVPGNSVTLQLPVSANDCPPGPYLLFLLDSQGVPSEGRVVSVSGNSCGAVATLSASTINTSSCSATSTLTTNGTSLGTDFKWLIDGVYEPAWDGYASITVQLSDTRTSAAVAVQVTPTCGGAPVTAARTATRFFPHFDPY